MNELWGSICHQNRICPATGYAVPYLIELLQDSSVQDKDEILGLLEDIVTSESPDEPTWRRRYRWRAGIEGRIHRMRRDNGRALLATLETVFTGQPLYLDVLQFGTGEDRQSGDAVSSCNPCEGGPFGL
jgi:hypothetical protein